MFDVASRRQLLQRNGAARAALYVESLTIVAATVVGAGSDRAFVIRRRRVAQAEAARRFGEHEVGVVAQVADLEHRHGEIAPQLAVMQLLPAGFALLVGEAA